MPQTPATTKPTPQLDGLKSFPEGSTALVVGASGGIGRALLNRLLDDPAFLTVLAWSRTPLDLTHPKLRSSLVDITDETSIEAAAAMLDNYPPLSLVIVATGLLHAGGTLQPERSFKHIDAHSLHQSFAVNAIGPALVAKHVSANFGLDQRAVFAALSARVGSIEDNRLGGWYSYRASKAALNQIIKTLSREFVRSRPSAIFVSLHPGTVDTALSEPFQKNVPEGQLFSRQRAADQLLNVIDRLQPSDTGAFIAWDAARIAY